MKLGNPLESAIIKKYPDGNVRQWFGENPELYQQAIGMKHHNGIDIALPQPCNVLAATSGRCYDIKDSPNGYGKHVRIISEADEDGIYYETTYGHLDAIFIHREGQVVSVCEKLGAEGNTGFVISGGTPFWGNAPGNKGVHLHFGLRLLTDKPTGWQSLILGKTYYVLNYENGTNGQIDPRPYLRHLILSDNAVEYLKNNENKLVQNATTGEIGIIKGGEVLVTSSERAGLLALTTIIRTGGGGAVPQELWDEFPKEDF